MRDALEEESSFLIPKNARPNYLTDLQILSVDPAVGQAETITLHLNVNGALKTVAAAPRTVLLNSLRERMEMTGTGKGCDHRPCEACTVLVERDRNAFYRGERPHRE
jgi:hypothetical protein